MTEIVISKSNKKDKKYDARIDGKKKQLALVLKVWMITQLLKMMNKNKGI